MRKSGILLPVFSLPSNQATGTLGKGAYDFIDFLSAAGQKVWQVLPLCPADYTNSPYQSVSCFAGNPLFIDFSLLLKDGLIRNTDIPVADTSKERADYKLAKEQSRAVLSRAFENFKEEDFKEEYANFLIKNRFWINDFALYSAIKEEFGGVSWKDFPALLKDRDPAALKEFSNSHRERINYHIFVQFIFMRQWTALKSYADRKGVEIFGDMPIYAAYDSADVWAHRKCFMLCSDGSPALISGTPPDAFSEDGQVWGSPLYDFPYMESLEEPYYWWVNRIKHALLMYDTVRIDHFRAFESFFAIPSEDKTAKNGRWIKGPGKKIFDCFDKSIGKNLPIVAEDLGIITGEVKDLLLYTGFAGMRVLEFGFDGNPDNPYLPHNFVRNTVAYIGTHDNETLMQFSNTHPEEALRLKNYIGKTSEALNWATVRLLMTSVADTVIFTMQDIMGTGKDTRINTPATVKNNWEWRMDASCPNSWLAGIIKEFTETYGR